MNVHKVHLPANLPNIDEIEDGYLKALGLYEAAFAKIAEADAAIKTARAAIEIVTPGATFHSHSDGKEVEEFFKAVRLPDRDVYLRTAKKLLTLRCWHYVVDRGGLRYLMDAQAKSELDAQLRYVPERPKNDRELIDDDEAAKGAPEFTAENVRSTILTLTQNAGMVWRRGIANAFSSLDRRFRSHDGFKVGGRVILNHMADSHGHIDTYGKRAETFKDIEKTFHVLDGRPAKEVQAEFLRQIERERRALPGRRVLEGQQSEHESEYLKVRIFLNGNAHLWFKRRDLVQKVNLELAAHYGEVIGDGQTQEPDPLESRAVTHARLWGFYPTPPGLSEKIAALVPYSEGTLRILEPSAGTGNIAFALAKPVERHGKHKVRHRIDAIEIQPDLATRLRESGRLNRVLTADFLQTEPPKDLYDGAVMNPPFDRERDIDHVTHALRFIKPDGFLISVMSAGVEFRESRKAAAFRKLLEDRGGWMIDLPAGSFADVGTYVNTVLVGFGTRKPWSI